MDVQWERNDKGQFVPKQVTGTERVIPAQLFGRKGEAKIGVTLHKREGPYEWRAFVRNAKRLKAGDRVDFGAGLAGVVSDKAADGSILWRFECEGPLEAALTGYRQRLRDEIVDVFDPATEGPAQPPYYVLLQMPGVTAPRFSLTSTFEARS